MKRRNFLASAGAAPVAFLSSKTPGTGNKAELVVDCGRGVTHLDLNGQVYELDEILIHLRMSSFIALPEDPYRLSPQRAPALQPPSRPESRPD